MRKTSLSTSSVRSGSGIRSLSQTTDSPAYKLAPVTKISHCLWSGRAMLQYTCVGLVSAPLLVAEQDVKLIRHGIKSEVGSRCDKPECAPGEQ
jgi:hypothetical protein